MKWLKSQGIRTVLNLRHHHGNSEGKLVEAAGMRYERIKLESTDSPKKESITRFLSIVDRTGAMIAIYRIEREAWTNTDALAEMEWFGAHGLLHDLRQFVGAYVSRKPG